MSSSLFLSQRSLYEDDYSCILRNPQNEFNYGPVSYTHLDVYKRQEICRQLWIGLKPLLTKLRRGNIPSISNCSAPPDTRSFHPPLSSG